MADTTKLLDRELPSSTAMVNQPINGYLSPGTIGENSGIYAGIVHGGSLIGTQNVHNHAPAPDSTATKTRSDILNWLCPQDALVAMKSPVQGQDHKRAHPKAGNRFLESTEFQDWLSMKEKRLWGTGPPGAGKTFLVSRIQRRMYELQQGFTSNGGKSGTAFLYMHHNRSYSCEKLLGCILRQFIDDKDEIPSTIRNEWGVHSGSKTTITADRLVQLIRDIATNHKLYLVVDAWDEYAPMDRERLLKQLMELGGCLALLMTSRFIGDLDKGLEGFKRVNISANEEDIRNYVNYCINTNSRLATFCNLSSELRHEIRGVIIEKSGGMFLLVRLHMESLEAEDVVTLYDVRKKLASFSNNLTDKYQDMMDRIGKQTLLRQEIAISTLAWITYAQKSLTVNELRHALAVDLKDGRFKPDKQPLPDDIPAFCCGMVLVEKGTLQLVHNTAIEFMRSLKETDERFINFDATISHVCAAYLCIPELEQPDDTDNSMSYATDLWGATPNMYDDTEIFMIQSGKNTKHLGNKRTPEKLTFPAKLRLYPLVIYAATHLGHHLRAMSDVNLVTESDALNKVISILKEKPKRNFYERLLDYTSSYPPQALSQQRFSLLSVESESESELEFDPEPHIDNSSWPSSVDECDPLLTRQSANSGARLASLNAETTNVAMSACREITSLHLAAYLGVPQLAKQLLSDPSLVHVKDFDGCTPLSIALAACHIETALLILEAGATLDLFSTEGCHLLLLAAQSDSSASIVVRRILKEALLIRGQGKNFVIEFLSWLWRFSATKAVYYSAKVARNCRKGWTRVTQERRGEPSHLERTLQIAQGHALGVPTSFPARRGTITFVDLPVDGETGPSSSLSSHTLRRRRPARTVSEAVLSPSEYAKRNYLKLVAAAFQNDTMTMRSLIEKRRVNLDRSVRHQRCYWPLVNLALFMAVERKEIDGVKILVEGGVDVNSQDYDLRTPLHRAVARRKSKLVRFLLEKNANVNAKDGRGDTPWVLAVINRDEDMSKLLIQHGADVNTQGPDGNNLLYSAAACGNISDVRFLLSQRVNPSITTNYFWAPLHWASANGHIDCVKLLLDAGAEVSPVSDTALTPLDLAIEGRKVDIEQLLRSKGAKRGDEIREEHGGPRYSYRYGSESEDDEDENEEEEEEEDEEGEDYFGTASLQRE
ncbi:uncharacterized protein F4817DRAFT_157429 [Daldinia loculata]|uniref:uncharacterized protein n=1 Tax=Daldinia loculata TaxID=103429 RepID=UPI0020C514CF|nr:uncharacterized protein F4817DRAFT_157429 [Daldinia loculata]KAI1646077.1 hypothetical protein F4817DRAFT_157429 [Daldinia loculata]